MHEFITAVSALAGAPFIQFIAGLFVCVVATVAIGERRTARRYRGAR